MIEEGVFIGTSGWTYGDWWGRFYPEDLPARHALEYYARHFNTVEINATFYRTFKDRTFENWGKKAPPGFVYSLKMPRLITHYHRLSGVEESLARFVNQARLLGNALGCILIQLPARFRKDIPGLSDFLALLPRDFSFAFEFRNASWFSDDVYEVLDRTGAGFVSFHHPYQVTPRVVTGECIYVRFHGSEGLYRGRYSPEVLEDWAIWIREKRALKGEAGTARMNGTKSPGARRPKRIPANGWDRRSGQRYAGAADAGHRLRPAFIYFNNDAGGDAIYDALALQRLFSRSG